MTLDSADLLARFLRYVQIDTRSDDQSADGAGGHRLLPHLHVLPATGVGRRGVPSHGAVGPALTGLFRPACQTGLLRPWAG